MDASIFIEEEFDYAHFIPGHNKCYSLHGHTAKIKVYLRGNKGSFDMVKDFGEIKKLVKSILSKYDHKLIVSSKYVKEIKDNIVFIQYDNFKIYLPEKDTLILNSEITTENLAENLCNDIISLVDDNIKSVRVVIYEGARKGAIFKKNKE